MYESIAEITYTVKGYLPLSILARAVTVRLAVRVDLYADGTCLFRRSMCEPPRYPPRRRVLLAVAPPAVLECTCSCSRVAYRWMAIAPIMP
jgi:hypothetical protein